MDLTFLTQIPWGTVIDVGKEAASWLGIGVAANTVVVGLLPEKAALSWGKLHGDVIELAFIKRFKNKFVLGLFYSFAVYVKGLGVGMMKGKAK